MNGNNLESKYMSHLPSVFHEVLKEEERSFIERYLRIFETILTEDKDDKLDEYRSLGEMLDIIGELFYPRFSFLFPDKTPSIASGVPQRIFPEKIDEEQKNVFKKYFSTEIEDFLIWMASWMSLVLKEDWDIEKKREVIAKMIPIYKIRGTKKGLEEYLKIYVGEGIKITEYLEPFEVGVTSTIGEDTVIGDGRPNYFEIYVKLPDKPDSFLFQKTKKAISDVIDREKPAHTNYTLILQVPTMQVGLHSTVGVDTLLGGLFIEER